MNNIFNELDNNLINETLHVEEHIRSQKRKRRTAFAAIGSTVTCFALVGAFVLLNPGNGDSNVITPPVSDSTNETPSESLPVPTPTQPLSNNGINWNTANPAEHDSTGVAPLRMQRGTYHDVTLEEWAEHFSIGLTAEQAKQFWGTDFNRSFLRSFDNGTLISGSISGDDGTGWLDSNDGGLSGISHPAQVSLWAEIAQITDEMPALNTPHGAVIREACYMTGCCALIATEVSQINGLDVWLAAEITDGYGIQWTDGFVIGRNGEFSEMFPRIRISGIFDVGEYRVSFSIDKEVNGFEFDEFFVYGVQGIDFGPGINPFPTLYVSDTAREAVEQKITQTITQAEGLVINFINSLAE
jgi:hypothetical protein